MEENPAYQAVDATAPDTYYIRACVFVVTYVYIGIIFVVVQNILIYTVLVYMPIMWHKAQG